MSDKRILIVEDEKAMAEALAYGLEKEGFQVETERDGESGWNAFQRSEYDLVLLDLMLPGMDGLEICRRVRQSSETPVIIITAKDSKFDKVLGLELGADDYVTKPFDLRELIARVRAVMRRAFQPSDRETSKKLGEGDVLMDLERHEITVRGKPVDLPLIEFRLLETFIRNRGKALKREHLVAKGWRGDFYSQDKALDVHIRRLREKIERDPANPRHIVTIRGIGYRFEPGS